MCTPAWHLEQDRGRSWAEAVDERVALFPEHADLILAYDERWHDMVRDVIPGSVAILEQLEGAGVPLYAITNYSAEKYASSLERFPCLRRFRGTVVSAHERLVEPDAAIFALCAERYGLDPKACAFIDDSPANVVAAAGAGFHALRFPDAAKLRADLRAGIASERGLIFELRHRRACPGDDGVWRGHALPAKDGSTPDVARIDLLHAGSGHVAPRLRH